MFVNVIGSYRDVVAICDKELLGKRFEEGEFQLDIKESFYKGEKGHQVTEKKLIEIIADLAKEDATFNIVGEKSIKAAIKTGLIAEEGIKTIQNIPFALVLM